MSDKDDLLRGRKYLIYSDLLEGLEEVRRLGGLPSLGAAANFVIKQYSPDAARLLGRQSEGAVRVQKFSIPGYEIEMRVRSTSAGSPAAEFAMSELSTMLRQVEQHPVYQSTPPALEPAESGEDPLSRISGMVAQL